MFVNSFQTRYTPLKYSIHACLEGNVDCACTGFCMLQDIASVIEHVYSVSDVGSTTAMPLVLMELLLDHFWDRFVV